MFELTKNTKLTKTDFGGVALTRDGTYFRLNHTGHAVAVYATTEASRSAIVDRLMEMFSDPSPRQSVQADVDTILQELQDNRILEGRP